MKRFLYFLFFVSPNFLFAKANKIVSFQPGYKERYKTSEFDYTEEVIDTTALDNFKLWLVKIIRRIFNDHEKKITIDGLNTGLHVFAIIVLGIVVFLILKAIIKGEGTWLFKRKNKSLSFDSLEEEDINLIQFEKLIQEAISQNDFRLAIRYYYLWVLKNYSDKKIISWHPEKTNSDYTYEIKDLQIKNRFKKLSYFYNYIWYGEFEIDTSIFEVAQTSFISELNKTNE